MYRNVNLDAHLSALLFLGSGSVLFLLVLASVVFCFWRRRWLKYSLGAFGVLALGYGALLLAFAIFSREHTLARGQEKHFCELDCHLAYSVQSVERLKIIGNNNAAGEFYVVTLRTRFDETTTAPWRPRDVPLLPVPLDITLVTAEGQRIAPSAFGQKAWDDEHGGARSMMDALRPGEAYDRTLVFDVPADIPSPRLLVSFSAFPTQLLIGDENSARHRKTYLAL